VSTSVYNVYNPKLLQLLLGKGGESAKLRMEKFGKIESRPFNEFKILSTLSEAALKRFLKRFLCCSLWVFFSTRHQLVSAQVLLLGNSPGGCVRGSELLRQI
jgi:hypothetical protein